MTAFCPAEETFFLMCLSAYQTIPLGQQVVCAVCTTGKELNIGHSYRHC
jgi:hypothetical protein